MDSCKFPHLKQMLQLCFKGSRFHLLRQFRLFRTFQRSRRKSDGHRPIAWIIAFCTNLSGLFMISVLTWGLGLGGADDDEDKDGKPVLDCPAGGIWLWLAGGHGGCEGLLLAVAEWWWCACLDIGEWDRGWDEARGGARDWPLPGPRPEYELGGCEVEEDPWLEPEAPPDNVLELLCWGRLVTFLTTVLGFGTVARFLSLLSKSTVLKHEENE